MILEVPKLWILLLGVPALLSSQHNGTSLRDPAGLCRPEWCCHTHWFYLAAPQFTDGRELSAPFVHVRTHWNLRCGTGETLPLPGFFLCGILALFLFCLGPARYTSDLKVASFMTVINTCESPLCGEVHVHFLCLASWLGQAGSCVCVLFILRFPLEGQMRVGLVAWIGRLTWV